MADEERLLAELEADAVLSPFFSSLFSAEAYVRDVLGDGGAPPSALDESPAEVELRRLRARAGDIDAAIKTLVSTHQDALFAQAGNTATLKREVARVTDRVGTMSTLASRLSADVLGPYGELKREARTLENVLGAMDVLRRVQRLHFNIRRLRGMLAPALSLPAPLPPQQTAAAAAKQGAAPAAAPLSGDAAKLAADGRLLARVAPVLRDVEDGLADASLAGVAVVDAERGYVATAGAAVREAARHLLTRAVAGLNAADVGAALQIFHDLACAPGEVVAAVDAAVESAHAAIRDALDVRQVAAAAQSALGGSSGLAPVQPGGKAGGAGAASAAGMSMPGAAARAGGPTVPPAGAAAAWRGVLWSRLEAMCDGLQRTTLTVWSLLYVACRTGSGGAGGRRAAATAAAAAAAGDGSSGSSSRGESLVAALASALATGRGLQPGQPLTHPAELAPLGGDGGGSLPPPPAAGGAAAGHPAVALLRRFWAGVTASLHAEVAALAASETASPFVRTTLADGYPRLHYSLLDVIAKAGRSVALRASDDGGASAGDWLSGGAAGFGGGVGGGSGGSLTGGQLFAAGVDRPRLLSSVAPLLRLYLGRSLQRLTEAASAMFPQATAGASAAAHVRQAAAGVISRGLSFTTGGGGGGAPSAAAAPFTPLGQWERYMDEPQPEPPALQATAAFIKALQVELGACKPPAATVAAGAGGVRAGGAGTQQQQQAQQQSQQQQQLVTSVGPDPSLYAAVARGAATAVRLLATKAEGASALGPSAVATSEYWLPTPAQHLNLGIAARLDEVRRAVVKLAMDAPLPPELERLWLAAADASDPVLVAAAARRAQATPLRQPLPAPALALLQLLPLAAGAGGGSSASIDLATAAAATVQGQLIGCLEAVDALIDGLLAPWLAAVAAPLERTVARLSELGYVATGAPSSSSEPPVLPSSESEYVAALEAHAAALSSHQLGLLPQGHVADAVRAAVASRVLTLWARLACLVSPLDDHGRMRLARDAAGVEAAVAALVPELPRLGRAYGELRAVRPFLFTPTADLLGAVAAGASGGAVNGGDAEAARRASKLLALLRVLRPANLQHALLARLPREASMPYASKAAAAVPGGIGGSAAAGTKAAQVAAYAEWLDGVAVAASTTATSAAATAPASSDGAGTPASAAARLFISDAGFAAVDAAVSLRVRACLDEFHARSQQQQQQQPAKAPAAADGDSAAAASAAAALPVPPQELPEYVLLTQYAHALQRGPG